MTPRPIHDVLASWAAIPASHTDALHHVLILAGILTLVMTLMALPVIRHVRADAETADRFRPGGGSDGRTARLMSRGLTVAVVVATVTIVISTALVATTGVHARTVR